VMLVRILLKIAADKLAAAPQNLHHPGPKH
jgi:hypothetical protein